jgi:4'-phosphopantetheinyl transferase
VTTPVALVDVPEDFSPALAAPRNGAVHLWHCRTRRDPARLCQAWSVLGPSERDRADRLSLAVEREGFILRRAMLRDVLAAYTGLPPAEVVLLIGDWGKPSLGWAGRDLHCSLAGAGPHVVVAIRTGGTVGVDIETLPVRPELVATLQRMLPPLARSGGAGSQDETDDLRLLRCWTAMEAGVKATGGSLAVSLAGEASSGPAWVRWVKLAPLLVGALAGDGDPPDRIRQLRWPVDAGEVTRSCR